tara:strand:- start:703 stop:984 length:282 start_codon:yes stop_codon:yes gene_type:complete
MDKNLFTYSESLVLSLCKELEYIKNRSKNIINSLRNCQNKILTTRLRSELDTLKKSRLKILSISESMLKKNCNELSFELLLEITKRSNSYQQI